MIHTHFAAFGGEGNTGIELDQFIHMKTNNASTNTDMIYSPAL